ncbi:hypothetical protein RchiOBHm_Chr4g0431151 [Rosa chinensis]|uniref:Uncharacterized protein n=1 Tax=Rosa chinensis TaxID=74649 RepID=A0A2P6R0Q2_ROSCH|nr:hypothetical protein RchiOBHm_Chr4g0431151 [Rosa chinensis]
MRMCNYKCKDLTQFLVFICGLISEPLLFDRLEFSLVLPYEEHTQNTKSPNPSVTGESGTHEHFTQTQPQKSTTQGYPYLLSPSPPISLCHSHALN